MQDLRTKSRIRKWIGTGLIYLLMAVFLIITVYPIIWMLAGALKGENEFYSNIWGLPSSPQWENYAAAGKRRGWAESTLTVF